MSIALVTLLSAASAIHSPSKHVEVKRDAKPVEIHRQPTTVNANRQTKPVEVHRQTKPVEVKRQENPRAPTVVYRDNGRDRDHDRDRDRDKDRDRERPIVTVYAPTIQTHYVYEQPQPVSLLGATALDGGMLTVDMPYGAGTIDLDAIGGGSTTVDTVVLYYANGASQLVPVHQMLDAGNPVYQLSLGGGVTRIGVSGHSECGGSIAIETI